MSTPTPPAAQQSPHELRATPDPSEAPGLRWGILGAGGIAGRFAGEVPERSAQRVVAVGSRSHSKAADFAGRHGIATAHGSYEALVADPEVDVVYVATPHSHHHDHAVLALEAGKPVLVEKAFTRNEAEARRVFDVAADHGLFAMEAMWSRFLPHMVALRSLVSSGALGEIVLLQADHGQRLDAVERLHRPELAGGALLDLGVYPVSFAHSILGAPTQVIAAGSLTGAGVDAQEVITLAYEEPTTAVCTATMLAATHTGATIAGREGRVDISGGFFSPRSLTITPYGGQTWTWEAPHVDGAPVAGGFQYQAAEVARCLSEGRTESATMPWAATLEVMAIMDEVRRQIGVVYPGE